MLSLELRSVNNDFIINITRFVYKICTINRDPCCAGLWQILEENRYPLSIIKHVSLCSVYVFITSHVCINDNFPPCLKKPTEIENFIIFTKRNPSNAITLHMIKSAVNCCCGYKF